MDFIHSLQPNSVFYYQYQQQFIKITVMQENKCQFKIQYSQNGLNKRNNYQHLKSELGKYDSFTLVKRLIQEISDNDSCKIFIFKLENRIRQLQIQSKTLKEILNQRKSNRNNTQEKQIQLLQQLQNLENEKIEIEKQNIYYNQIYEEFKQLIQVYQNLVESLQMQLLHQLKEIEENTYKNSRFSQSMRQSYRAKLYKLQHFRKSINQIENSRIHQFKSTKKLNYQLPEKNEEKISIDQIQNIQELKFIIQNQSKHLNALSCQIQQKNLQLGKLYQNIYELEKKIKSQTANVSRQKYIFNRNDHVLENNETSYIKSDRYQDLQIKYEKLKIQNYELKKKFELQLNLNERYSRQINLLTLELTKIKQLNLKQIDILNKNIYSIPQTVTSKSQIKEQKAQKFQNTKQKRRLRQTTSKDFKLYDFNSKLLKQKSILQDIQNYRKQFVDRQKFNKQERNSRLNQSRNDKSKVIPFVLNQKQNIAKQ